MPRRRPTSGKWEAFVDREKERGVNLAILIGGEPTLFLDRVEAFYRRLPTYCATNGLIKMPRDRFPDMMVGISLWGELGGREVELRGRDMFCHLQQELRRGSLHLLPLHHHPAGSSGTIRDGRPEDRGLRAQGPPAAPVATTRGSTAFPGPPEQLAARAGGDGRAARQLPEHGDLQPLLPRGDHHRHACWAAAGASRSAPRSPNPWTRETRRPKRLIRFIRWASGSQDHAPLLHLRDP